MRLVLRREELEEVWVASKQHRHRHHLLSRTRRVNIPTLNLSLNCIGGSPWLADRKGREKSYYLKIALRQPWELMPHLVTLDQVGRCSFECQA